MTKTVAVNALSISDTSSGSKTYLIHLLFELTRLAGDDYKFYVLCTSRAACALSQSGCNKNLVVFSSCLGKPLVRILFEQFYLPIWLFLKKIDLLFAARNVMPLMASCPTVIGVLSMHLNYENERLPWWRKLYGPFVLNASAKRASAYVSISKYAGETYIEKYGLPRERLFIAPLGYNRRCLQDDGTAQAVEERWFNSEYLLFVSTLFPHKNIRFLLDIFARVVKSRPSTRLIIVGRDVFGEMAKLKRQVDDLHIANKVMFTGAVSDHELRKLFANAHVFVFPSLIEGFGLTVLEAMANSVPVVTSNRTSIPEVVGEAGIVLDPEDEQAWADIIVDILNDDRKRNDLSRRSYEQARLFTWRRTAEIVLDSFRYVLHT